MPKVHVTLPNGHKYTIDDPDGTLSDSQAYQFALKQDPDAQGKVAQDKSQDTADHPWRDILSNAPSNLLDIGKKIVTAPIGLAKTAGSELMKEAPSMASGNPLDLVSGVGRAAYHTLGGPAMMEAGKEAIAHPSEILPAFQEGLSNQDTMNSAAAGLATLPIAESGIVPAAGRLVTRGAAKGLAKAASLPDALASSLPAQELVTAKGALGVNTGGVGTVPGAEQAALLKIAEKNVNAAVQANATNPTPFNANQVKAAVSAYDAAKANVGKSTVVGRLATKTADAMRVPDRFMQNLQTPQAGPAATPGGGVPPAQPPAAPPAAPPVPPAAPPAAPPVPPGAPPAAPGAAPIMPNSPLALQEISTPHAQKYINDQFAQNSPIVQDLQKQGMFGGDRTTGGVTPEVMKGVPGENPVIAQNPQMKAADSVASQNRVQSGVLSEGQAQRQGILDKLKQPSPDDVMRQNLVSDGGEVDLSQQLKELGAENPFKAESVPGPAEPGGQYPPFQEAPAATPVAPAEAALTPDDVMRRNLQSQGNEVDLSGELNAMGDVSNIGTAADMRQTIADKLKDPTATLTDLRRQVGADRIGKTLAPEVPDASSGAVQRIKAAPSAMPDRAQEALLRDLSKPPSAHSPETRAKIVRAVTQLTKEYERNGGPADSDVARALFEMLTK